MSDNVALMTKKANQGLQGTRIRGLNRGNVKVGKKELIDWWVEVKYFDFSTS